MRPRQQGWEALAHSGQHRGPIHRVESIARIKLAWESPRVDAVQISDLLEALEEVAVPVEEDDVSTPDNVGKKSRSRTVTTSDVKYLQSQMEQVGQAVNDATTMMTRQALGTAWTSLRRLLAKMHKAKSKAGILTTW